MKMKHLPASVIFLIAITTTSAQVDTTYIYKTGTPYGTLDLRIAKSTSQYYFLQEGKTVSYRESSSGVRTETYLDLTSWNSDEYKQGNLWEKNGSNDNFIMNYRLLLPQNYNERYSPGYPMIIVLHGLGERGNCWDDICYHANRDWNYNTNTPAAPTTSNNLLLNNDLHLMNGGAVHLDARNLAGSKLPNDASLAARAFPGFVLFPQNLNGWNASSVQDAIRIIRLLTKKYNIDENKIIIHGLSNGGGGTFEAIKRAPWLFSAALMMSPISDAFVMSQGLAPNIAQIPMWIFQGGKDTGPLPSQTERTIKGLREAGADVRYTLYPNLGHGTWNTAYKEPDFFSWMLARNKAEIHTFAGNTAICLTSSDGVKLELAEGFYNYQWQKDGALINSADDDASYLATTPGIYRARFSRVPDPAENEWTPWSSGVTVTQQTPAQAEIQQHGTIILPDLNGNANAALTSTGSYPHYYWHKNNALLNFDGDQDDTLQSVVLKPTHGSGTYTLVTSAYDNCPSPVSGSKYVFFNNDAPVNITSPVEFKGQSLLSGAVKLTWLDQSSNEDGFEIWSRKVVSESTYEPWKLRTITEANAVTYTDEGLEPMVTYHYKIRGVSKTGRSEYTPVAQNEFVTVKTLVDEIKPSPPQRLQAIVTGINTIKLTWEAPAEANEVRQYHVYYNGQSIATGSTQLYYVLTNLEVNTIYHFNVKTEDLGGNLSFESNSVTEDTYMSGLYYEHSTGNWSSLENIDWSLAEFTGIVDNFSLEPRTQDDYFNFKFDGYLYIQKGGVYQFSTTSSDGSRVMIDSIIVVDNDGIHEDVEIVGEELELTAGPKKILVTYFEYALSESLTVRYKGPDTEENWIEIPDEALRSGDRPEYLNQKFDIILFPNPTTDQNINVQVDAEENGPLRITVIDSMGKLIYEQDFNAYELRQGITLKPHSKLNSGLYLINVIQQQSAGQAKIAIRN
jgi:predicted peptidase